MNDLESTPPATPAGPSNADVQLQLTILLVGVIVLSATFSAFLYKQVRTIKAEVNNLRAVQAPLNQAYEQQKDTINTFLGQLAEYGRTHADFEPIMRKYQLYLATNNPAMMKGAAPATAPKPAVTPAPAPKK